MQTPLDKFIDPHWQEKYDKWLSERPKCWKCGKPITAIVEMTKIINGEWQQVCLTCFQKGDSSENNKRTTL